MHHLIAWSRLLRTCNAVVGNQFPCGHQTGQEPWPQLPADPGDWLCVRHEIACQAPVDVTGNLANSGMSNPVEIDLVKQPTHSTDLALEDLIGELGETNPRSANGPARIEDAREY